MRRLGYTVSSALISLALLLSACGQSAASPTATSAPPVSAPTPTSAPAPTDTTTPPTATSAPQTLRLATTTSTDDSGLLDAILPDFEAKYNAKVDVVAVGTVADGHAQERFDVMYNDFIVVGPKEDPARIAGMTTAKDAFKAIMDAQATFASRGDKSGTNTKELSLWASLNITPTADMKWYNALGQGMGETLTFANEQEAYTLSDRGTYLAQKDNLPDLVILVGGNSLEENKDKSLLNPYGVMAVNPDKHPGVNFDLATKFVEWITSVEEQQKIFDYGKDKFGQPLFYPSSAAWKAAHP
ncbi:MAG: Tungstate ABC transporter [Anaerolineales bacterium]|nr:Tungstate ABC transporter [Anaerolineales bacterium]